MAEQRYFGKQTRHSIQKHMILTYAMPIIIFSLLSSTIGLVFINRRYLDKEKENCVHICEQAANALTNHLDNMYYIFCQLDGNQTVQDLLADAQFGSHSSLLENYLDFYHMNTAFGKMIAFNHTYEIGLYLPAENYLSVNYQYFYPENDLTGQDCYEKIQSRLQSGAYCIETILVKEKSTVEKYRSCLAFLGVTGGGRYTAVVKCPETEILSIFEKMKQCPEDLVYLEGQDGSVIVSSAGANEASVPADLYERVRSTSFGDGIEDGKGRTWYVITADLGEFGGKLVYLLDEKNFNSKSHAIRILMLLILFGIVVTVVCASVVLARYYTGRLTALNQSMEQVRRGEFLQDLPSIQNEGDEFDEIYQNFNAMADRLVFLMKEQYRLGKQVMSAQLHSLQAQINPHFLYNTLDLINWDAMRAGADDAASIARNLGQFYRLSLNHGKSAISVADELLHVRAYVNIENQHFDQAIQFQLDVDEAVKGYACLNMLLQPFVENAIVHGIAADETIESSRILLQARLENEKELHFVIRDDGPGMTKECMQALQDGNPEDAQKGYGVRNVNFRIKLCYGETYGIRYESEPGAGTTVHIRIPALTMDQLSDLL